MNPVPKPQTKLVSVTRVIRHDPQAPVVRWPSFTKAEASFTLAKSFTPLVEREPEHLITVDLGDLDPLDRRAAQAAIAGLLESFKRLRRVEAELTEIKEAIGSRVERLGGSQWPLDSDGPLRDLKYRAVHAQRNADQGHRAIYALVEIGREAGR